MNQLQKDFLKLFSCSLIVFIFLIATFTNIDQHNPIIGAMQFIFGVPALLILRSLQH